MIKPILLAVMVGMAGMASPSWATQTSPAPGEPAASVSSASVVAGEPTDRPQIRCADYRRLADGAWTPRKAVVVGGVALSPGTSFTPGVAFSGVDIAALLEARCVKAKAR